MISNQRSIRLLEVWEQAVDQLPANRALTLISGLNQPQETAGALPVGDRDRMLLLLRRDLFGDRIEAFSNCPYCNVQVELDVSASELCGCLPARNLECTLDKDDYHVQWRLPTSSELAALSTELKPDRVRQHLVDQCFLAVRHGGEDVHPRDCPADVVRAVCEAMADADPLGDVRFALVCPDCNKRWEAEFDICSFLFREIDIWARRLLGEVHCLASTYSWSEREILAMSAERRKYYLEMVGL